MNQTIKDIYAARKLEQDMKLNVNVNTNTNIVLEAIRKRVANLSYGEAIIVTLSGLDVTINLDDHIALEWINEEQEFSNSTSALKELFSLTLVRDLHWEGFERISVGQFKAMTNEEASYDYAWSIPQQ